MDNILKMTIYWHLKYSCGTLFLMSEEEKEKECRRAIEIMVKDLELWEFLKSFIRRDDPAGDDFENLDLKFSVKGLKISFIEKAILMGLKDACYLMKLQEQQKTEIPLLTKFI